MNVSLHMYLLTSTIIHRFTTYTTFHHYQQFLPIVLGPFLAYIRTIFSNSFCGSERNSLQEWLSSSSQTPPRRFSITSLNHVSPTHYSTITRQILSVNYSHAYFQVHVHTHALDTTLDLYSIHAASVIPSQILFVEHSSSI